MTENIQQRNYYRLFTGTNQEDGHDKIHLGYEAETTEIILNKDQTASFHMPFFSKPQPINQSTLVADGATAGPIPALADRVYKKLGNYGNTTPWGEPSERHDGTWLCSWLYAVSSEPPVWLDRYYNPGRLAYREALEGIANFTDYVPNNPIYYDVPSTLILEPGVLYQYFHQGEITTTKITETFAGNDKTRLRLDIEDWSCLCPNNPEPVDKSIYNNTVVVDNFKNEWIISSNDPGYLDRNALSFNNTDFIDCKVIYDPSYTLPEEFTLSFWVNNNNWSLASSTQLLGNLRRGGFGVFYNNLHSNPFFVVPENFYGHLFYFNQDGEFYTEKNTQIIPNSNADPRVVCVNLNSEVISLDVLNKRIIKYNHIGDILTFNRDTLGGLLPLSGTPMLMTLSGNNDCIVITTTNTYVFDQDLILKYQTNQAYGHNEQIAFNVEGNLIRELSCIDIKFDSFNQKWTIKEDNSLYCNNVSVSSILPDITCTNLAIDPDNNIWVLNESNNIYKIDPISKTIISTFEVGVQSTGTDHKNISFIKQYNRKTNSFTWYSYIFHNNEKVLYQVTLDGKTVNNTTIPTRLNILDPNTATQDKNLLQFLGRGDFTGYEQRRIFHKLLYNNNHQIQFKIATKSLNRSLPTSIKTFSIPVQYFTNESWHLLTITLKNNQVKIFVDNYLRNADAFPGNVDLTYEFKNDLFVGTPCGKTQNYNLEINTDSIIWNGYLDSVRVYDYAIEDKFIAFFIRGKTISTNIEWNIPTTSLQYIEVIDRFFKHRSPGSKSIFFNMRLTGSQITDPKIRQRIEEDIKLAVLQIKPAYTDLLNVEWVD
jgi:hypothetical protein